MAAKNDRICSSARLRFAALIILSSSVTNLPAVRWLYTNPSRSSSVRARCMVLGLTRASVAKSRTDGSRSPGGNAPETIPTVHLMALWVALGALIAKELLFRYMLAVAERVRSSMLVANAWHARSDAASSLVVGIGIGGNLLGVALLDPIAALVVGCMVSKMGWSFMWDALHDLTDRAANEEQVAAISAEIRAVPGVLGFHELKTRKTGDMILADVHLEIDGSLSVTEGHDIAERTRINVMTRHPVLYLLVHVDPVTLPTTGR